MDGADLTYFCQFDVKIEMIFSLIHSISTASLVEVAQTRHNNATSELKISLDQYSDLDNILK